MNKFMLWIKSKSGRNTFIGVIVALLVIVVIAQLVGGKIGGLTGTAGVVSAPTGPTNCLPSCDVTDGRMFSLASSGYNTLAGATISIEVAVPASATSFDMGFFDGDTGGIWDLGTTALVYTLFADPNDVGDTSIQLEQWTGSSMADNVWTDFSVTQDTRAQSPSGAYFYYMQVSLPNATTVKTWSNFKVRSNQPVELSSNQSFAYTVPDFRDALESKIIYPSGLPTTANPNVPTTYDGTWDMYVNMPTSMPNFVIWDGDMDFGSYDCSVNDTKDTDTPNNLPSWAIGTLAVVDGVATSTLKCVDATGATITGPNGEVYASGNPSEDTLNFSVRRSPNVIYDVIDPNGNIYHNTNPSGNMEWEQFRIDSDPNTPADYYVTGMLPAGVYHIHVTGLDMNNLNAWHLISGTTSVCMQDNGKPCVPVLHPYLIGDTVWLDANGNGVQDNGETGIPGVTVTLLDVNGQPLPGGTATTDANGQYTFSVYAGTYSVQVDANNFSGGALAGMVSTTGGEKQTNTVTTANVLTYDFGYQKVLPTATPSPTATATTLACATPLAPAGTPPSTTVANYCGYIRSPGFWKNYKNHMTDAAFLNLLQYTQDFSYLTVSQATTILGKNNGTTKMGISALDGVDASFLKFLLTSEINAVWNGQDNTPALGGLLGTGYYQGTGKMVNQLLRQAYLDRKTFSTDENNWLLYLGAGGETATSSSCLVRSIP